MDIDPSQLIAFALFFPGFLFSLSVHEAAHGWVANKLGDATAKSMGRVTVNPIPHIDPIGTLLLPTLGFFFGGIIIGWGKPVMVDYRNLKKPKSDGLLIAAAGPVSNLITATLFAAVLHGIYWYLPTWLSPEINFNGFTFVSAIVQVMVLNLALAFFNLIPIHPLDGGKIFYGILPEPMASQFDDFMSRFGFMILILLFITGAFSTIIGVPIRWMAHLLIPMIV